MNNDKNNGSEQRGYQPSGNNGKFGYQPSRNPHNTTNNGSPTQGATPRPPKGSSADDA